MVNHSLVEQKTTRKLKQSSDYSQVLEEGASGTTPPHPPGGQGRMQAGRTQDMGHMPLLGLTLGGGG